MGLINSRVYDQIAPDKPLSKNARRKAERYGNNPTVGKLVGTARARLACRERYQDRLAVDNRFHVRYSND